MSPSLNPSERTGQFPLFHWSLQPPLKRFSWCRLPFVILFKTLPYHFFLFLRLVNSHVNIHVYSLIDLTLAAYLIRSSMLKPLHKTTIRNWIIIRILLFLISCKRKKRKYYGQKKLWNPSNVYRVGPKSKVYQTNDFHSSRAHLNLISLYAFKSSLVIQVVTYLLVE